jgi:uncharacterized protein (PEP-CTERM system associated)
MPREAESERLPFPTSPGDRDSARRLTAFFFALPAATLALLAGPVRAAKWDVVPTLSVAESYTDNVFLAPDPLRQSDWVTQVIPGISITAKGARLRFDAKYAPEILYYANTTREEGVFHRGNAVGTLEVAEELLFLEGGAGVNQYDISLQGPQTTSNVNITGNRATAATAYVSPYLLRDFGSTVRAEARYTYSAWKSDEEQKGVLPDNDAQRVVLRLASGPAFRLTTWGVAYSGESIKYETQQETTSQVFTVSARHLVTTTMGLLAQVGYERYDTGAPAALEGERWSAGFEWAPTPRTRLAATAGQRLDDETYGFEFRHRTGRTTWSATYAEDVTTSRSEFFLPATASTAGALDQMFLSQYPDPVEREKAVQEFIARTGLPPSLSAPVNFFSDQLFRQNRWLASVGVQGVRNTVVANAFWQLRRELAGDTNVPVISDFSASESIRMAGGGLAWSLRLTARNTWNLDAGYRRSEFLDSGHVEEFTYLRAGVTRQMQRRVSGSLQYRLQKQDATQGGTEYRENAGIALLRMTF